MKFHTYDDLRNRNQNVSNLNRLEIEVDGGDSHLPIRDGTNPDPASAPVRVLFDNIEQECVSLIQKYDLVVGCAAWFTSEPIIQALSQTKYGCQIIVQKEDFLRPDSGGGVGSAWAMRLRSLYSALRCGLLRLDFGGLAADLSYASGETEDPVRCVGNHNADRKPASPRMHHKFLVLCDVDKDNKGEMYSQRVKPKAVWTGSFNLTKNAGLSLENVVVIESPIIAQHYYDEWAKILGLSEALNWQSEWCFPEYRIGT